MTFYAPHQPPTTYKRLAKGLMCCALLAGCHSASSHWNAMNVSGSTPDLAFDMQRSSDGKEVTAADYRSKIVLLYFGYTYCPDACPLTLSHLAAAMRSVKNAPSDIRVLFVTVDPKRDTLPVLKEYAANFGPEFVGLRGSDNELATLAKRYRIAYSVTPDPDPSKYVVTHSSAIYAFDRSGKARLLIADLSTTQPDVAGTTQDLDRLVNEN